MRRESATLAAVAASLLALNACAGAPAPVRPIASTPPEVIKRGRAALSEAGINGDLRLVASEPTQWPDSSLGCPQPKVMYMQVITPGHALRFAAKDGRTHAVHVAGNTAVVCTSTLAASGAPKRPNRAIRATQVQTLVESARKDLATRLTTAVEKIRFLDYESVTWPDENLGCHPSGAADVTSREPGAGVAGFKLFLSAHGQPYTYHTDATRTIPCPPIEAE